jgi:sphingomyelin phosphodiesterase acid-like 3
MTILKRWVCRFSLVWVLSLAAGLTAGWMPRMAYAQPGTFPAVMLSDLHFDPFHDPAKVPQLVKAPTEQWEAILKQPDSPTQAADFSAVQDACHAKQLTDSPYVLLKSALQAAKAQAADAKLVTVSGDLIVHDLDCRYRAALHLEKATSDDQSISAPFAEKATVFVMKQVEATFPKMPVYLALGNNDSRCNHNRLDVHDAYLKATAQAAVDGLAGVSAAERLLALSTYEASGYYAVTMAAPMKKTRLLVLDDTYMMSQYANCEADAKDRKGAEEQIEWLGKELDAARERGEHVWVMGHVPPTVSPNKAMTAGKAFCASGGTTGVSMFLYSDELADVLESHADVVTLAIFGHTHMDELHLLQANDAAKGTGVPIKVVSSVSPVDGNLPSVTVGRVLPASAQLVDYSVFVASNATGVSTTWAKEYSFDETYRETAFTAASLEDLIGRFRADLPGVTPETQAYIQHFYKGGGMPALALGQYWQGYVCSMDHPTAASFKSCACQTLRTAPAKK